MNKGLAQLMTIISVQIFIFVFLYLISSFYYSSFDISTWSSGCKISIIIIQTWLLFSTINKFSIKKEEKIMSCKNYEPKSYRFPREMIKPIPPTTRTINESSDSTPSQPEFPINRVINNSDNKFCDNCGSSMYLKFYFIGFKYVCRNKECKRGVV